MDRLKGLFLIIFFILLVVAIWAFFIQNLNIESDFFRAATLVTICVLFFTLVNIKIGMILFILFVSISPETTIGGVGNLRYEDFILPILLFSWITRLTKEREEFAYTSFSKPLIGFIITMVISTLVNYLTAPSLDTTKSFFEIAKWLEYCFIFMIFANNVKNPSDVSLMIIVIVIGCFISGVQGVRQYLEEGWVKGPPGETPNIWAGYYVANLALLLALASAGLGLFQTITLLIVASLDFYSLLFTYSRTSYIALVVGLLFIGILRRQRIVTAMLLFFVMASLLATSKVELAERASSILGIFGPEPPSSFQARLVGWTAWFDAFLRSPIVGVGVGVVGRDIDNEFVRILASAGIFAFIFFVWFLVNATNIAIRSTKLAKNNSVCFGFSLGFIAIVISLIVHSFGASSFTTIRTAEIFMITLGIQVAIYNIFAKAELGKDNLDDARYNIRSAKIVRRG